jgi:hypothetical protein
LGDDMTNDEMIPYGTAFINGFRVVFNPYKFIKGKNKGKIQCYYRRGNTFKKIVLREEEIKCIGEKNEKN